MLVSEIMRKEFYTFKNNDSLETACRSMNDLRLYGAPVVDDNNRLVGVFTRPHLIRALMQKLSPDTLVENIMQSKVITIKANYEISETFKLFIETGYHHYPVTDNDGVLIGLVVSSDLMQEGASELYKLFGNNDFDYFDAALIGIDHKGYIRSVSETALEFFGMEAPEILNKHIIETVPIIEKFAKDIFSDAKKVKELSTQLNLAEIRIEYYRSELNDLLYTGNSFNEIIGISPQMKSIRQMAIRAAKTSSTVLIRGESGTGKELLAHTIHNFSPRCKEPFIKVNCAAIPENLIESELFGYCEGAFTGAIKGGKPGKFELADGGSIFLDEIGDLQPSIQSKLLRVLQEFEFERLGAVKPTKVDVRVIAATNRNLKELISNGQFREDLFYRISVVELETTPLRERKIDIDYLIDYLIEKISHRLNVKVAGISNKARIALRNYDFPGNVRELENILERAINFVEDEGLIEVHHFPPMIKSIINKNDIYTENAPSFSSLAEAVSFAEETAILKALKNAKGNRNEAARALNIHRSLLYKKIIKYNIARKGEGRY
ncbi:MAG TPA: sigma 54-interacting transcriptional regulator [Syntrophomonadaceae bacterium]|nr:sigma 54-interacting transcriptional regulator [Syntrophomonadaceae bacterium]HNX28686.1 sigma 54-interacting transcriptional regulator [Syntrophomonadaceae bacterium]HPR93516.1 sigma 54-interacting transcriptional regulator [Syntrophomonadaceae bacterium]